MNPYRTFSPVILISFAYALACSAQTSGNQVNQVQKIGPAVYFHEGDIKNHGHCNNGWIVLEDYVLVVDGNFPSGAQEIIPKIKAITSKPIRFAFDTHHHGDHAYGNAVWVKEGAVPVAHEGVVQEMMKFETGYFGDKPGRWEDAAKGRPDMADLKLKPPTLLFPKEMTFDDGKQRVELHHFGTAHTRGDGFAWLPKERILFTGDACVNGPYNFMGDGDSGEWVKTLEAARKLAPKVVCPGHGPMGGPEVLDDQLAFFVELRALVKSQMDEQKEPFNLKAAAAVIKERLQKNPKIARYVGGSVEPHVAKVYREFGGKSEVARATLEKEAAEQHAHQGHGLELVAAHVHAK